MSRLPKATQHIPLPYLRRVGCQGSGRRLQASVRAGRTSRGQITGPRTGVLLSMLWASLSTRLLYSWPRYQGFIPCLSSPLRELAMNTQNAC